MAYTRSENIEYIDGLVKSLERKRSDIDNEISRLINVKSMLLEPGVAPLNHGVFLVDSRSGGKPHVVSFDRKNGYDCSCEAGTHGVLCWAVTGIKANLEKNAYRSDFTFYNRYGELTKAKVVNLA